jgi:hypothetical protein
VQERVLSFQQDFERPETGKFEDIEQDLVAWHDGGQKPKVGTGT